MAAVDSTHKHKHTHTLKTKPKKLKAAKTKLKIFSVNEDRTRGAWYHTARHAFVTRPGPAVWQDQSTPSG